MKRRVAILISGRGSNMAALIKAAVDTDFPAEIAIVISNRADAAGLEKAKAAGAPVEIVASKPFGKDRAGFEQALQAVLPGIGRHHAVQRNDYVFTMPINAQKGGAK